MTLLQTLLNDIVVANLGSNWFDVQIACYVAPKNDYVVDRRPNDACTKVIHTYEDASGKRSTGTSWADDYSTDADAALRLLKAALPDWWVADMGEDRTPIHFVDEQHEPLGTWHVLLQHRTGGKMTVGKAATLPLAICAAVINVKIGYDTGRWTS